jgi:hypothetical protein
VPQGRQSREVRDPAADERACGRAHVVGDVGACQQAGEVEPGTGLSEQLAEELAQSGDLGAGFNRRDLGLDLHGR